MASPQVEVVGLQVRLVAPPTRAQVQSQGVDDAAGNLVLNGEDIGQRAIEPVGPQAIVIACPDQRDGDAQLVAGVEDRSFDQVIRPELPAGFAGRQPFALDGKG